MPRRIPVLVKGSVVLLFAFSAFAQNNQKQAPAPGTAEQPRPQSPLFFREEWKPVPGAPVEHPVTQAALANPNLELKLYGPSGKDIQENGGPTVPNNPTHVWTGLCAQTCALAVRDKNNYVDLSGLAKIHWYTKVTGLHQLHLILKLADGTWILGEHGDGTVFDYHDSEFTVSEERWIKLDIDKVVTRGRWLDKVDLTKVDEIGFTDLMPGSGHGDGGYSDLGWFEVYGKPVPRNGGSSTQQQ
jgi:hypothetical protein